MAQQRKHFALAMQKRIAKLQNLFIKHIRSHKNRKQIFFLFFFCLFASAPLVWGTQVLHLPFLGYADFLSPFNLNELIYSRMFVYEPNMYAGINFAFLIAQMVPVLVFYFLLSGLSISPAFATLFLTSLILLLSEISMFLFLRYVLREKLYLNFSGDTFICFIGGIFYALSPYIIALLIPGHILQLFIYATLPAIILVFDQLLSTNKNNFQKYLLLFGLFFFNAATFANIGMVYVLLIILGIYYLPATIAQKSFIRNIPKFIVICCLIFISNIWWMLPFIISIFETVKLNEASNVINASLNLAVSKATIINLMFGRGEGLLYMQDIMPNSYYLSPFILLLFFALVMSMIYAVINSRKFTYINQLLFVSVISLFITKGINEPFGSVFLFLYNNFPGFQIFRRPVSKFYWMFIFALIALAIIGIAICIKRSKSALVKQIMFVLLPMSAIYLWLIFALTPALVPFSIPAYYYQAEEDLKNQRINKLLVLPGFFGTYPSYNDSFNNYYGIDFIEYMWHFSHITPDSTVYSPNLPYKRETNRMTNLIAGGKDFCESARKLGVSHILIREDINLEAPIENKPVDLKSSLASASGITSKKEYKDTNREGFTIYQLSDSCTQQSAVLVDNSSVNVSYTMVNPVKYEVRLEGIKNNDTIMMLQNFDSSWVIYDGKEQENYLNKNYYQQNNLLGALLDFRYVAQPQYDSQYHLLTNGYANGWKVNIEGLNKLGAIKKNTDGSYTAYITLYYRSQLYFYVGLIIFSSILIITSAYVLYSILKRKNSSRNVSSTHKKNR